MASDYSDLTTIPFQLLLPVGTLAVLANYISVHLLIFSSQISLNPSIFLFFIFLWLRPAKPEDFDMRPNYFDFYFTTVKISLFFRWLLSLYKSFETEHKVPQILI